MIYNFFDSKSAGSSFLTLANKSMSNQLQLSYELYKPIIRKVKRRRVSSSFEDNTWDVYLRDMQLISKYNKIVRYLSCAIDLFSK